MEAPYYGVPCINLGSRQNKRVNIKTIINCPYSENKIIKAIDKYSNKKFKKISYFGIGKSNKKFIDILLHNQMLWDDVNQKYFKEII